MSVQWSAWAWEQRPPSAGAKLVLLVLADAADDEGWCSISLPRLADYSAQSAMSVHRKLGQLVDAGLIERESGQGRTVSRYRLLSSQPVMT